MTKYLSIFAAVALLFMATNASAAEDIVQDDFGGSYFTESTPTALTDNPNADYWADQVSTIEPASGDDLFVSPDADDTVIIENTPGNILPQEDRLAVPEKPIIPGQQ